MLFFNAKYIAKINSHRFGVLNIQELNIQVSLSLISNNVYVCLCVYGYAWAYN